jgi:L-lactate dehydrogenase complex protein LldF
VTYLGMPTGRGQISMPEKFPAMAEAALANTQLRRNLARATSTIRAKRASVVAELPDWPQLRAAGAAIKDEVLAHLDDYLVQLEARVTERGGTVHWAPDATAANEIVVERLARPVLARWSRSSPWPPRRSS